MNKQSCPFNNNEHTFVIAEAGSNWKVGNRDDDINRAKKLIEVAAKAGADAVKFQTFSSKSVYVPNAGQIGYLEKNSGNKNINEIFDELSMSYELIPKFADICEQNEILFMSTPFSVQDANEIDPFVTIHKVASFEINHVRLLENLAKTKKPILISTGASTYVDIDFAVNFMNKNNSGEICLMQCTSKYPAPIESLNIQVIPTMKERYKLPVGLSDHSVDPVVGPLLAIGMGATVIEKHFTLDKNLTGPDHTFSLTPNELTTMVNAIRSADRAKGNNQKTILPEERELRNFATRTIQAIADIEKGDVLREGFNFDVLRPGNRSRGFEARFLHQINGKKATEPVKKGEGIKDFE